MKIRVGRQIAEGGFSFVFEATDDNSPNRKYALKRISCPDQEILQACHQEAGVHRAVRKHPHLMPLLGMLIDEREKICYMLFPYLPHSLRSEVNRRILDTHQHPQQLAKQQQKPWPEAVLQLFYKVLLGVQALHAHGFSHRDIKLENILLAQTISPVHTWTPVLMDFGSAGPLTEPIQSRRQLMNMVERASMHTTMPYRPPELFDGHVRAGDPDMDFRKVDVWSLGCTLFGILYGASPAECEFPRSRSSSSHGGRIMITDCTQLSVLKPVPRPPEESEAAGWYTSDMHELVEYMLEQDRSKRPGVDQVMERVQQLILKQGGKVPVVQSHSVDKDGDYAHDSGEGISLMSRRV